MEVSDTPFLKTTTSFYQSRPIFDKTLNQDLPKDNFFLNIIVQWQCCLLSLKCGTVYVVSYHFPPPYSTSDSMNLEQYQEIVRNCELFSNLFH